MQNNEPTDESLAETRTFILKRYSPQRWIERYSYMLIRPPRFVYCEEILNPATRFNSKFEHYVFHLPFKLSLYCPRHIKYVLLYLHGNSSSRYEGFSQLGSLPQDVGLACFDFAGCGNRHEKQFISLGKHEAKDVDVAVKFLREKGFRVAVWGRSMGAVSALLSQEAQVVIADSAFSSLYQTCRQISKTQVCCPCYCFFECFFPCFFWAVSRDVEQKSLMDPSQMEIKKILANSNVNRNILLLAAKDDRMINSEHSNILFNSIPGPNKKLLVFEGTHNSDRPREVLNEIFSFTEASFSRNTSFTKESLLDSKNADIDSIEGIRNDRGLSVQFQSETPGRDILKIGRNGNPQLQAS